MIDAMREPTERAPVREQRFVPMFSMLRPVERGLLARARAEAFTLEVWERVRRNAAQND